MEIKPGFIEFKSQQEIYKDRREKTKREQVALKERLRKMLREIYRIVQNTK
jgi:hypothetical protein